MSLASIVASVSLGALAYVIGTPAPAPLAATLVGLLITWKHRGNIQRLARGTERRMGAAAS